MENSILDYGMFFAGCILVLLSLFIIALNYRTLYENHQNKKHGNPKYVSMISLAPQVLLILACIIFQSFPVYTISGWLLLGIALADPGIWFIIWLPVAMWLK